MRQAPLPPGRRRRRRRGRPRPRARCTGSTRRGSAPGSRAEERVQEGLDRALQVAQGDALADHQALDLLEHRRVGDVVVAAEHLARADDAHLGRVRVLEHVADLRGGGVGAQQQAARAREVEGVLHVARRVVGRHVERLEAVVVVLDLGAVEDLVAHRHEDVLELLAHGGERMPAAPARARRPGQRDVEPLARGARPSAARPASLAPASSSRASISALSAFSSWPASRALRLGELPSDLRAGRRAPPTCGRGSGRAAPAGRPRPRSPRRSPSSNSSRSALRASRRANPPGRRARALAALRSRAGVPRRAELGGGLQALAGAALADSTSFVKAAASRAAMLGQRLPVEHDARPLEPRHELAVGDLVGARGRVDADDPQAAEVALLALAARRTRSCPRGRSLPSRTCRACSSRGSSPWRGASSFLRFSRRLAPRLTLGMVLQSLRLARPTTGRPVALSGGDDSPGSSTAAHREAEFGACGSGARRGTRARQEQSTASSIRLTWARPRPRRARLSRRPRFRPGAFFVRMWRFIDWPRLILPVGGHPEALHAPRGCVFSLSLPFVFGFLMVPRATLLFAAALGRLGFARGLLRLGGLGLPSVLGPAFAALSAFLRGSPSGLAGDGFLLRAPGSAPSSCPPGRGGDLDERDLAQLAGQPAQDRAADLAVRRSRGRGRSRSTSPCCRPAGSARRCAS